jgi:formate dehydrogenase major subunit
MDYMKVTRRDFIKISGVTATGLFFSQLGFDLSPVSAYAQALRIKGAKETTTICPYCGVGCGIICHSSRGKVINTEGDPDHPINQGALCAKGAALYQWVVNENRVTTPLYRAPGSSKWKSVSWDWALDEIAKRVKASRDKGFVKTNAKGQVVNRTNNISHVGSAALDNEECWTLQAMMRALGLVYIEHQARI